MRATLVSFGVVFTLLLAGCGGSSHKSKTTSSTSSETKTTTTHGSTTPTRAAAKPEPLGELIVVAKSGKPAAASVTASAGQAVQFLTRVPGTRTSSPVNIHLDFSHTTASQFTVTASAKGQKSTATLKSKSGAPLTLVKLRYSCALPPITTFCPVSHVHSGSTHVRAQFSASPATPVVLTAVVGPLPNAPVVATSSSSLVAPTYTVLTKVLATDPHASKSTVAVKPGPTASVHPGDGLLIRVGVTGKVVGAPQNVTLSFAQGPSKSLTVTASVPGGTPSTATISASNGKRIEVVSPRYTCLLPPAPTFCPLAKVIAGKGKYTVDYAATPQAPPMVISAAVQGG